MKKYVFSLALLFMLCTGSLYLSYHMAVRDRGSLPNPDNRAEDLDKLLQADNRKLLVVNNGMRYTLETYDISTGTKITEILNIPTQLLGKTREQVIEYLNASTQKPSVKEKEEGLVHYALSSFSAQSLTVLKTIDSQSDFEYYLVAENGYLLVYLSDRTTNYLFTHIALTEFPEKEQSLLMEGKGFHSMIDLFNYLESYTS